MCGVHSKHKTVSERECVGGKQYEVPMNIEREPIRKSFSNYKRDAQHGYGCSNQYRVVGRLTDYVVNDSSSRKQPRKPPHEIKMMLRVSSAASCGAVQYVEPVFHSLKTH